MGQEYTMTPQEIQSALELAARYRAAGRFAEAEGVCRGVLAQNPDESRVLGALGFILFSAGRFAEAAEAIRRAIVLEPGRADLYGNLSLTLTSAGKLEEAAAACRQAIALKPDFAKAYDSLGRILRMMGKSDQAAAVYRQGIEAAPGYVGNYVHLGEALYDKGQIHEAMAAYRRALVVAPDCAEAAFGLGVALKGTQEVDESMAAYERAIALRPDYGEALMNLGIAQMTVGRLVEACDSFRRSMEAMPGEGHAQSNLILTMHYRDDCDPSDIAAELRSWNQRHAEPLRGLIQEHQNDPSPDRRLRIGYLSPDFRGHPVGRFLLPLLENHDHKQFEIFCYSDTKDLDGATERLKRCADVWKDVREMKHGEIAEAIRADGIDILVDLTLHTSKNRLLVFAQKPAPVQVTYLGYCGSSGMRTMDYRLTDPWFDPPGGDESGYSEKSIVLPRTWWCYVPTTDAAVSAEPPSVKPGYVTFGCQNNYCKLSEGTWSAWIEILRGRADSRLLVYSEPGRHRETARKRLADAGIDPERLIFSDSHGPEYFLRYRQIDIALDPFPFAGGTTSCDSIWMGVPFVTLKGPMAVGRAGVSILHNIGLPELIARTREEYVRIAVDLAGDPAKLADIRKGLRERMRESPLMDAASYARDVEAAYRGMWGEWCKMRR
jgi:protein O-GlcNAc transferase